MLDEVSFDMYEILAMTSNHLHPHYKFFKESINKDAEEKKMNSLLDKMTDFVQGFLNKYGGNKGITKRASYDLKQISASRGDFTKIREGMVEKNIKMITGLLDIIDKIKDKDKTRIKNIITKIKTIHEHLKKFKPQYEKAYDKKIEVVCKEYECFSYVCILAASHIVVNSAYAMHEFKKLNPVSEKNSARQSYFNPDEGSDRKRQNVYDSSNWAATFWNSIGILGILDILRDHGAKTWLGTMAAITAPLTLLLGLVGYFNKLGKSEKNMVEKMLEKTEEEIKKSSHEEYLKEVIKAFETVEKSDSKVKKESVDFFQEDGWIKGGVEDFLGAVTLISMIRKLLLTIGETAVRIVKLIWNTITGLFPLIQTIELNSQLAEVSSIQSLEEEIEFIEMNIESMKRTSKLPADKQKKVIEYQKKEIENHKRKIAKIKAKYDLIDAETEKKAIEKSNAPMISRNTSSPKKDDDFVLD